ncbi:MAG: hypothetical protein QOH68_4214, partial [Nocardioidaceae bacterium]|nr:hypothetical protein [Nocardioidaceae bacterium]
NRGYLRPIHVGPNRGELPSTVAN